MKKLKELDYSITPEGDVFSHRSLRFLKNSKNNSGYYTCKLYKDGVVHYNLVHRLVAELYIPNPDNKPCVNHKDGDKENNSVSNLEWCTYSENNEHSKEIGLTPDTKKYPDEFVHLVFKLIMDGVRSKDICSTLGISKSVFRWIVYGGTYTHIKNEYDFENHPKKYQQITDDKVIKICKMLENGESYKDISSVTGVSTASIGKIKNRKIYRVFSESFNF